jgi:hypothetical protein
MPATLSAAIDTGPPDAFAESVPEAGRAVGGLS